MSLAAHALQPQPNFEDKDFEVTFTPRAHYMIDLPDQITLKQGERKVYEVESRPENPDYSYASVEFSLHYNTIHMEQTLFTRDSSSTWVSILRMQAILPDNLQEGPLVWGAKDVMLQAHNPSVVEVSQQL